MVRPIIRVIVFAFTGVTSATAAASDLLISLHAAPFEVAPVMVEVSENDPILADAVPVLETIPDEGLRRQIPWHWVIMEGRFTGYFGTEDLVSGEPRSGARLYSAPDLGSPVLFSGQGLPDTFEPVDVAGPFTRVRFLAELPLYFDPSARPSRRGEGQVIETAMITTATDFEVSKAEAEMIQHSQQADARPGAGQTLEAEARPVRETPHDAAPAPAARAMERAVAQDALAPEGGAPLRVLRGTVVTASSLKFRRSPYRYVLVSESGVALAFVDVSHLVTGRPNDLLNRPVQVFGELKSVNNRRISTVMVVRSVLAL